MAVAMSSSWVSFQPRPILSWCCCAGEKKTFASLISLELAEREEDAVPGQRKTSEGDVCFNSLDWKLVRSTGIKGGLLLMRCTQLTHNSAFIFLLSLSPGDAWNYFSNKLD